MLRAIAVLLLTAPLASPALAWEFRAGAICELTHADEGADVRVTYDPAIPEYAIEIAPARSWSAAPLFAMRFDGPRGLTIMTDRHVMADGGSTLTVRDRGFGNVLDGLEFNDTATALLGDQAVTIPLDGAAPEVRAFRDCASGVGV